MLFEAILFGAVGFLGYVVACTIAGFIFMVAYGILSILIEEAYNVVHDLVTMVIRSVNISLEEN